MYNIEKLTSAKDIKKLTKALTHFAEKKDVDSIFLCIEGLAKAGDSSDAFEYLAAMLKIENPPVCRRAIMSTARVREIVRTSSEISNYATEALIGLLKKSDPLLANETRKAMNEHGYSKAVRGLIDCLSSSNTDILVLAVETLGKMDDPQAIAFLEPYAARTYSPVGQLATKAISELKSC